MAAVMNVLEKKNVCSTSAKASTYPHLSSHVNLSDEKQSWIARNIGNLVDSHIRVTIWMRMQTYVLKWVAKKKVLELLHLTVIRCLLSIYFFPVHFLKKKKHLFCSFVQSPPALKIRLCVVRQTTSTTRAQLLSAETIYATTFPKERSLSFFQYDLAHREHLDAFTAQLSSSFFLESQNPAHHCSLPPLQSLHRFLRPAQFFTTSRNSDQSWSIVVLAKTSSSASFSYTSM